jgi:hypothetical protein
METPTKVPTTSSIGPDFYAGKASTTFHDALTSASVILGLDIQIGDRKISKDWAGKKAPRLFIQSQRSLVTLVKAKEASSIMG